MTRNRFFRDRQQKEKCTADTHFGIKPDFTVVVLDNSLGDAKTQPCPTFLSGIG